MPDKPWRPQDRTPEVASQEIREVKQPEPSLDAHRGVETGRDLSREREADAEHAEERAREIRETLLEAVSGTPPTTVEARVTAYVEKHLPEYLKHDHVAAKVHRAALRVYVDVQEALGMLSVEGREYVPADGPFLVVANHSRPSDDKRILGILRRPIHIATADFHFNMTPISRWLMKQLGEIEIRPSLSNLSPEEQRAIIPRLSNRMEQSYYEGVIADGEKGKAALLKNMTFLRTTVATLLRREPVLFFPEGLWTYEGHVLRKAYPGLELVAREYRRLTGEDLPILPIGLDDRRVRIGETVSFTEEETTDSMMRRVATLLPEEARGYYKDQV